MYLGHRLSRSRDVIGQVIILSAVCGFPMRVTLTPTRYLELFARY